MIRASTENLNVVSFDAMPSPAEIKARLPITEPVANVVSQGRGDIQRILDRQDPRLMVIVGPCSIHDTRAGLDYARRLKGLAEELADTLYIVMRVYFEKPRTTSGWKGLINDPYMDDSFRMDEGMSRGRRFASPCARFPPPARPSR